jgi:hypothetical protein
MTHDELLAKIDKDIKFVNETFYKPNTGMLVIRDRIISRLYALRAVVELHKPFETTPPWEYVKYMACGACESWTTDGAYYIPCPCPTIQAIEKELG